MQCGCHDAQVSKITAILLLSAGNSKRLSIVNKAVIVEGKEKPDTGQQKGMISSE